MKKLITLAVVASLTASCALAQSQQNTPQETHSAAAPGVSDRLHAIKLKGQDGINQFFVVSIGNGYTKAMIADKPAKIKRVNSNFYEITNSKYVISVALDENGLMSASWNRHKGRDNGMLSLINE
ncbi:hypothetical protein [Yokenella regensburgei]|uniref:Uncharacterized protein n=1 Tax=Yokenella regensburgei TaxID=158877 RepID=A0AB38FY08_9ENTR|nr:hypothetical protein [Yokenella regensburgei]KFD21827.1 hypothetical protein GYRE_03116 [Yokenella regensburgei ATCC 49455]SQA64030.1 Uncharacterised protein [Yokenella regensburgei]SQA66140.1 Uncharacterised protein [Yokenella regensburgei]SUQ04759.1 Uncharacterised protein [Yokenella regensburgei]